MFNIDKNVVTIDVDYFKEHICSDNYDYIICKVTKINNKILKDYNSLIYKVSLESINLLDLVHIKFYIKLVVVLQETFKDCLEKLYLYDCNDYVYIFDYVKKYINKTTSDKIIIQYKNNTL